MALSKSTATKSALNIITISETLLLWETCYGIFISPLTLYIKMSKQ